MKLRKFTAFVVLLIPVTAVWAVAKKSGLQMIPRQVPPILHSASDLGPEDPNRSLGIRVWLKLHQPELLAQYAREMNDRRSANFEKFFSPEQFKTTFAPSPAELEKVKGFLVSKNLAFETFDANQRFVRVRGTVATVEKAFNVKIRKYQLAGQVIFSNAASPRIEKEVADLVQMVGGLNNIPVPSHRVRVSDGEKGSAPTALALTNLGKKEFETNCFRAPETKNFTTSGALPSATYQGNRFGSDLTDPKKLPPCGYGPRELHAAYGMRALYERNLDGSNQSVAIVDAFGSPTIQADVATFSEYFKLAKPVVTVHQPGGNPVTGVWTKAQQAWAGETTLDVEYVHTMAPGAAIELVEALTDGSDDMAAALAYTVDSHVAEVVSGSWGGSESRFDEATKKVYSQILESAAVCGIAVNFSSGDHGDLVTSNGYADVFFPASSPWVTAVGGTTLALNEDRSVKFETGWGNSLARLTAGAPTAADSAAAANAPLIPPTKSGFIAGSGGGASRDFKKPYYQRELGGETRQVPDIAFLADPYTGVQVIQTPFNEDGSSHTGHPAVEIVGGTSLAAPLFSGLWAVAQQGAGKPLGHAAPRLYGLTGEAINDVIPVGSKTNVTGSITIAEGTVPITALELAYPATTSAFYSALVDSQVSPFRWSVITFGTDSSLVTGAGWDNVTGLGTPNGEAFVDALSAER